MNRLSILSFVVLMLAACGGKAKPAPVAALVGEEKRLVEETEARSAAICACTDLPCLVAVHESHEDPRETPASDYEITDEGARRWGKATLESQRCMHALIGSELPKAQQAINDVAALRDRACACDDAACGQAVMDEFIELGKSYKDTKGSDAMVEEFKATFEEMHACVERVRGGDRDFVSTGLPSCDAYVEAMDRYLECDKIPQATRDAARQGIDAMKDGWAEIAGLPKDVRQQAEDGCRQAVDALTQGATALGCTI